MGKPYKYTKVKMKADPKTQITGENFKEFLKQSAPRGSNSCPQNLLRGYDPFPNDATQ